MKVLLPGKTYTVQSWVQIRTSTFAETGCSYCATIDGLFVLTTGRNGMEIIALATKHALLPLVTFSRVSGYCKSGTKQSDESFFMLKWIDNREWTVNFKMLDNRTRAASMRVEILNIVFRTSLGHTASSPDQRIQVPHHACRVLCSAFF